MSYLLPDFVDNDTHTLSEVLTRTQSEYDQQRLDIATGYFAPKVWELVGQTFSHLEQFRLLLGEEPAIEYGGITSLDLRAYYRHKIADDLAALAFDKNHLRLVDALLDFLQRERVEVRLFDGPFLHAKAYIFDRVSFVGSSNFTPSGLTRNSELMLTSIQQSIADALRSWFENKWADSSEYKQELIATLEASKFGSKPYTPYEVFIKALYEYFKDRINLEQNQSATVDLARFQEEGKVEAIRLLDKWGGVLVADAVGLGKTFIGLSLLEHELLLKRSKGRVLRGLIICPAQLRELVWDAKIDEYGIPVAKIISQEELGRADFNWKPFTNVDVVLVDESHNFRNPETNRYRNLIRIISSGRSKRVILMSATPVNNTLIDLYTQLALLARGDDRFYREAGISNLRQYIKAVMDGGLEIFDLLEVTTIRRSRADIRRRQDDGEAVFINGKPVRFPDRQLHRIEYDLDGTYQGFYNAITRSIEKLHLVSYNLAQFARKATKENQEARTRNTAIIALMKMLYLKRLESSSAAFQESILRQMRFQEKFLALLQKGKLLDSHRYRKILAIEADEEAPDRLDQVLEELPAVDPTEYNMTKIEAEVEEDVVLLQEVAAHVQQALSASQSHGGDSKLQELRSRLQGELKGQKVLIFTSFADTARYIYQQLTCDQETAAHPEIGLITGETKAAERKAIIEHFAPNANRRPDQEGGMFRKVGMQELQVLISTDVLSEGQNLQDAGVIINYDLHWNPVRLIQRAGRVDRIGSAFEKIHLYNFFPEDELENLLQLVSRLTERISQIDKTVGLDASVLGEVISVQSLEQLRKLHHNDQQLLTDLERQSELVSTEDMKFPLLSYMQQIGKSAVEDIPLGIHSGKIYRSHEGKSGYFLAFCALDRHFWRFYPDGSATPETQVRRIFPMIACAREEGRKNPGVVPYELIEQATADILLSLQGELARVRSKPPMTKTTQKLYSWLNRPSLWGENTGLASEQLDKLNAVLNSVSLKPFERDHAFKSLVKTYEESNNFSQFVSDLDVFFVENGLYQESNQDQHTVQAIKEEDLKLVCFERLLVE